MSTNKTLSELVRQLQGGYDVFQELWEHDWVQNIIKRERRKYWNQQKEEIDQNCRIAVWKVIRTFDPISEAATVYHLNTLVPFRLRKLMSQGISSHKDILLSALPGQDEDLMRMEADRYSQLFDMLNHRLNEKERVITCLLADGWTQAEITRKLGIDKGQLSRTVKRIQNQVEQVSTFPTFRGLLIFRREEAVNVRRILADRCALSNDLKTEDIMAEQSALISKLSRVKTPEDMDSFNKALSSFTVHYNTLLWELFGADEGEWTRTKDIAA